MITQKELFATLNYDPITGIFTRRKNRGLNKVGDEAGYINKDGYRVFRDSNRNYRMHHLAWLYMYGTWPANDVDHINTIKHDNRFENLRASDKSKNACNTNIRKNNTSGIKGVYWSRFHGKWCCDISLHEKRKVKYFKKIDDAITHIRLIRNELHGEFANHG